MKTHKIQYLGNTGTSVRVEAKGSVQSKESVSKLRAQKADKGASKVDQEGTREVERESGEWYHTQRGRNV